MRSTKLLLSLLSLSLFVALPGAMAAQGGKKSADAAQGGKFSINGGVVMYNACNNNQSLVEADGYTEVDYQVNGNNVTVHVLFHNNGSNPESGATPYRLNLEASQNYNAVAASYEVPYHSVWTGPNGTFTMDGTLQFGPAGSDGNPYSQIRTFSLGSCTQ